MGAAFTSNQTTVGATATPVVPAPASPPAPQRALTISNGAAVVYVGGPNVTVGTGMPIPANTVVNIGNPGNAPLYAICATSSVFGYLTTT